MNNLSTEEALFFNSHFDSLPLYLTFKDKLFSRYSDIKVKVSKTQISFYNKHLFACISFIRVIKGLKEPYIIISLGLDAPIKTNKVMVSSNPYPGRYTNHFLIQDCAQIDEELMTYVNNAYVFSDIK